MNTLNKICTALTVVFAVSLLVLLAEILYVLYRRRRFQNRNLAYGDVEFNGESLYSSTPSKELLYCFCWRSQANSRIEPDHAETTTATAATVTAPPLTSPESDIDVDEILKRHAMYGPSRVLFTIKEEEREEMEMELSSSTENEEKIKYKKTKKKTRSVSLEEIAMVINIDNETTPFSTPCASPPYYTPSPSPDRNLSPRLDAK